MPSSIFAYQNCFNILTVESFSGSSAANGFGKLDVFVNNAGIGPISLLDELRVEDWDEKIDINLKGVLYGMSLDPNLMS